MNNEKVASKMSETLDQKTARLKAARLAKEAEFQRTHEVLTTEEAKQALKQIKKERKTK